LFIYEKDFFIDQKKITKRNECYLNIIETDDDLIFFSPVTIRKVPKSLEEIVRLTKFTKSEIRLLYKGFKQVRTSFWNGNENNLSLFFNI